MWVPTGLGDADRERESRDAAYRQQEITLRNRSSAVWAGLSSWGLFVVAAAVLNGFQLRHIADLSLREKLTGVIVFISISVGAWVAIARPCVKIDGPKVEVRNPLRNHTFTADQVSVYSRSGSGYPILEIGDARIRVWSLERSLYQVAFVGVDADPLGETIGWWQANGVPPESRLTLTSDWRLVDRPLSLLLVAWAGYLSTFVIA